MDIQFSIRNDFPLAMFGGMFNSKEEFPIVVKMIGIGEEYIRRSDFQLIQHHYSICDWDTLASCSPVLETLARWEPEIKTSDMNAVSMFIHGKNTITQLTDYMQGRKIKVADADLYKLLYSADMLQVESLVNYCKERISNFHLDKDNYAKILNACYMFNFEHDQMDKFIRGNLIMLCKDSGLLTLCPESVGMLLTDEELSYWSMKERFVFIVDWCKEHDGRNVYFEKWFDHLDLSKMDNDFIEKNSQK